jgi:general L-amino acid transport system substrate-binding protein
LARAFLPLLVSIGAPVRKIKLLGLIIAFLAPAPLQYAVAGTLEDVRKAGTLACGVNTDVEDYSKFETHGDISVLGRDICRAVAAAVLGDPDKSILLALPDDPRSLAAIRSGQVALLAGATPDLASQAAFGVNFGPPVFFDGQGFLVHTQTGLESVADLRDKQVCFITETQAEADLNDKLASRDVRFIPFPFEETGEMEAALVTGHCTAIAAPVSQLASMRTGFHALIAQYEILPDMLTLEPFAPAFRSDDPYWATIVSWTINSTILAEEAGITQSNAASQRGAGRPEVRYLLGGTPGVGKALGLDDAWALRAVLAVGNYGEMYERDLGSGSPLRLPRGHNALWTHGGLIYAPPIR